MFILSYPYPMPYIVETGGKTISNLYICLYCLTPYPMPYIVETGVRRCKIINKFDYCIWIYTL